MLEARKSRRTLCKLDHRIHLKRHHVSLGQMIARLRGASAQNRGQLFSNACIGLCERLLRKTEVDPLLHARSSGRPTRDQSRSLWRDVCVRKIDRDILGRAQQMLPAHDDMIILSDETGRLGEQSRSSHIARQDCREGLNGRAFRILAALQIPQKQLCAANTDSFTEKGGAAALTDVSTDSNSTFTTLGLRASTSFDLNGASVIRSKHAAACLSSSDTRSTR